MSSTYAPECFGLFSSGRAETESLGHIAWISHEADEKTRTVKVRVDVQNNGSGTLVVHSFGCGRVVLRDEPNAILVPNDAVQSDGTCSVVFVKDRNSQKPMLLQIYHVRQVRLGGRSRNSATKRFLLDCFPVK